MIALATSPELTAGDARRLLSDLSGPPRARTLGELETAERYTALSAVFLLRAIGAQHGPGAWREALELGDEAFYRKPSGLYQIDISAIDWDEAQRIVNRHVDIQFALYRSPPAARDRAFSWIASARRTLESNRLQALIERAPHDEAARLELTRAFLAGAEIVSETSLLRLTVSFNESEIQTRLGMAALALAAYRHEHGGWPARLDELAPSFVGDPPPIGYWTGYDFRYHPGPPQSSDADLVTSFAYSAAPRRFGVSGVGSFCVDATGARIVTYDGSEPEVLEARCVDPSR